MTGDYGSAISLSRDHSPASNDSSSNQTPCSLPSSSRPSTTTNHHRFHHNIQSPLEVQKKPKGRPPGSKNKPKPPIIVTKEANSIMKPNILQISAGSDLISSILSFARKNLAGCMTVLSATGTVSNVTLRHPASHAPSLLLHGPFSILSLSGSFLGSFAPTNNYKQCSSFAIALAGAQGQVFGGVVAGKIMAASQVVVVAATFLNPILHKLSSIDGNEGGEGSKTNTGSENSSSGAMSRSVYGMANPNLINSQISPEVMQWGSPPPRPSHY